MPRIPIRIQVTISEEFVQDMAISIMEDWPMTTEEAERAQVRLAAQPEFRDLVAEHICASIETGWDLDPWDYADVGEVENLVLADSGTQEFDWLREEYARAEQVWDDEQEQERLLAEARLAEENRQQNQVNEAMIRQLRSQGYVIYQKPKPKR